MPRSAAAVGVAKRHLMYDERMALGRIMDT